MRFSYVLIVALGLVVPASAQTTPESMKEVTEVGGRSLEQWIKDITHKDPSKRENSIRAVMGFGPEKAYDAVPAMLKELGRYSPNATYTIDTSVRINLAISLGAILTNKKDPDPKYVKEAVLLLTRLLGDSQGIVKFRATQALAGFGMEARGATTSLLVLLKDGASYEVRHAAATTLGKVAYEPKINGPLPNVITALQSLLVDPAYQVRQAACQSLSGLGPPTDAALKLQITKALEPVSKKDSEPTVQIWAHIAIIRYNNKASDENLVTVTQYLHKGDLAARIQAAQALGVVGTSAKETVPALIGALDDADPNVIGWAIWALGRMESGRAIPALEKLAADAKAPELKKQAKDVAEQLKKKMTK